MATDKHTFSELIVEVMKVGHQRPDRVAEDEYFDRDGLPCCIFGHAFSVLGVTPSDIDRALGDEGFYAIRYLDFDALNILEPSKRQMDWAARVQDAQDQGDTWGRALEIAGPVPA